MPQITTVFICSPVRGHGKHRVGALDSFRVSAERSAAVRWRVDRRPTGSDELQELATFFTYSRRSPSSMASASGASTR